jgi:ribosome-associated protein
MERESMSRRLDGGDRVGVGSTEPAEERRRRLRRRRSGEGAEVPASPAPEREIRVTRSVLLPVSEIEMRVSHSSGPGGQHAQKSSTRVEALLDVEASSALTEVQKRRVVARSGAVLRAVAQDERSQLRNRELATERLVEKLRAALAVPRRRVPTRPSASSRERRLEQKKRRSAKKRLRRPPTDE